MAEKQKFAKIDSLNFRIQAIQKNYYPQNKPAIHYQ